MMTIHTMNVLLAVTAQQPRDPVRVGAVLIHATGDGDLLAPAEACAELAELTHQMTRDREDELFGERLADWSECPRCGGWPGWCGCWTR